MVNPPKKEPTKFGQSDHTRGDPGPLTGSWFCRDCGKLIDVGNSHSGCKG